MDGLVIRLGATRGRILRMLRRSTSTIAELADALGITGNAVRGHLTALQRDGLVREAGTGPSTGGKPARRYDLTSEGEEAFPKAYAFALEGLIRELRRRHGRAETLHLLREVGREATRVVSPRGGDEARVHAAADALRSLGADVVTARAANGWEIRGFGCPLSAVVLHDPDTCSVVRGLVADVTGRPVVVGCDRSGGRPSCAFTVLVDERTVRAEGAGAGGPEEDTYTS